MRIIPLFALLASIGVPAAAVARAPVKCQLSVTASADGSFAEAGYDSSPARLSVLAAATGDRLAAAARRLCAENVLRPGDLLRLHKIVVQNGEGATEPVLYRTPSMPPGTLIFQYAFQNGGPPEPAAFEDALRCWKRPSGAGCYED
jgi:hypothetical protein